MSNRVLIAEASCSMRKIILRSLQAYGIDDTAVAADGDQAMGLFRADSFDLVLTEWTMPVRGGEELIREIRTLDESIPILLVTTEMEMRRVPDPQDAGHSDYLVKPFSAAELAKKLRQLGC